MNKVSSFGPVSVFPLGRIARLRRLLFGKAMPHEQAVPHSKSTSIDKPRRPARHRALGAPFAEMQIQLAAALSAAPGTRKALCQLAHFERSLAAKGAGAIDALAVDRLRRAHKELIILLSVAPASAGLVSLERRMRGSVAARSAGVDSDAGVQVSDGTLADFDQVVSDSNLAQLSSQ